MELLEKRSSTGKITFYANSFRITDEIHRLIDEIKASLYKYILRNDTVDAIKSYGVEIDLNTDIRDLDKMFGLLEAVYNFYVETFQDDEGGVDIKKPDDDKAEDLYIFIGKYLGYAAEIVKTVYAAMRDICRNDNSFECYSQHYGVRVNNNRFFFGDCEFYDKDNGETLYTFADDYDVKRVTPRKLMVLYDVVSKSNIDTAFKTLTIDLNAIQFLNRWYALKDKGYNPDSIETILRNRWEYDYKSSDNNSNLAERLGMFNPDITVGELIKQLTKRN